MTPEKMTPKQPTKPPKEKRSLTAPNTALYALLIGGLSYAGGIALDGAIAQAADNASNTSTVPSAQDLLAPVIKANPLPPAPPPVPTPNVVLPVAPAPVAAPAPIAPAPVAAPAPIAPAPVAAPAPIAPAPVAAPAPIAPAPPPIIDSPTVEFSPTEDPSVPTVPISLPPVLPVSPASPAPINVSPIDLSEVKADTPAITINGGSNYIDTTDYGIGATPSPNMVPDIIITERSTGCKTVLLQGQGIPANACGHTNPSIPSAVTAVARQPHHSNRPGQPLIPLPQISAVTIGPLSIGANGIQITRRLSVQDYYKRTERPQSLGGNNNTRLMFPLSIPAMISSPFGLRIHPIFGTTRMHTGTDLAAPMGTPVVAAYSGRVAVSDFMGGYGLTVVIGHRDKSAESLYGHLSEVFVKAGEWVEQGEIIGRVGSTGNSTGPHLHFELRKQTANGWVAIDSGDILQNGLAKVHEGFELGAGFSIANANLIDPTSGEVVKLSIPNVLQQGKDAIKDGIGGNTVSAENHLDDVKPPTDDLADLETNKVLTDESDNSSHNSQVYEWVQTPSDSLSKEDASQIGEWVSPKE